MSQDGSYILAYEKDNHEGSNQGCWISLRYYKDINELKQAKHSDEYHVTKSLVEVEGGCEGTPSFEYVNVIDGDLTKSIIVLRFHFYKDAKQDQQAIGTLIDWNQWTAKPMSKVNDSFHALGYHGNTGSRDKFSWKGKHYYLVESQTSFEKWESWRVFLCDNDGHPLTALQMNTPLNSTAFANPNISMVEDGKTNEKILIVSCFMPSEGNHVEEKGSLIYVIRT